ncbi:lysosomal alpha-mannosidase [Ciona intestinalis]
MLGLFIVILASCCTASADVSCGYHSCNLGEAEKLNIHLVPHTHDDVGWLKTVDQYYYGSNSSIVIAGVQYILDSVIPQLLSDPSKRFIYVEIAFFSRWWEEQNDAMKENVKQLVQEGRLEFILGGWCMNDEASTHYNAIIDQMTHGLRYLNDTFGACARPRVAWQIDPFGHSREQASLFAQMGFDGLFFGRLDYEDKENREKKRNMEEIWRGSQSLNSPHADLFTGVDENGYNPPDGFCFDAFCRDQPIMDNQALEDYNVDEKVEKFVAAALKQANHFQTNHIMMTMGSDFEYSNANVWYKNLDKLIKYVNAADKNMTLFYSTPSCYLYALNHANVMWNVKSDDFFPYADAPHQYWTGYFTSRPGLKGYVRESNKYLQVCNQLETFMHFKSTSHKLTSSSKVLRDAMGVAQHHDAVSGTSKQHVANDYAKRLYEGREECNKVISTSFTGSNEQLLFCDYLNITLCDFTQSSNQFVVLAYNPLAREVSKYLRIPVNCDDHHVYVVEDLATSTRLTVQLVPVSEATLSVRRDRGNANCELIFLAKLPALGHNTFQVTKHKTSKDISALKTKVKKVNNEDVTITNEFYKVKFDGNTGLMASIENIASGITVPVKQDMLWYNASMGNDVSKQQSGAYIFRPNVSTPFQCSNGKPQLSIIKGSNLLVQEVYQKFSDWVWQVIRLYAGKKQIEVEWTVGPIPVHDKWGKEVISRYETNLETNGYFYTDSNGREILERRKDYRPTWHLNQSEFVAGNYYPVNSRIYIHDNQVQLTVLNDRSQGGSSLSTGQLELMVHRRLLGEDSKGVGEALNETGQFGDGLITRGKHWLLLDTVMSSAKQHRLLAEEIYMSPLVAFQHHAPSITHESHITSPLPPNIHLLTLSTTTDGGYIVRVEHQFEKNEDSTLSKPATVSLKNLFTDFQVSSCEELLLGGNAFKQDVTRLSWETTEKLKFVPGIDSVSKFEKPYDVTYGLRQQLDSCDVTLEPMQIRTFLIK